MPLPMPRCCRKAISAWRVVPLLFEAALAAIIAPLSRLVVVGALLRRSQETPNAIEQAFQAASSGGPHRSLLAWMGGAARARKCGKPRA
jgi:hypothetical protein